MKNISFVFDISCSSWNCEGQGLRIFLWRGEIINQNWGNRHTRTCKIELIVKGLRDLNKTTQSSWSRTGTISIYTQENRIKNDYHRANESKNMKHTIF